MHTTPDGKMDGILGYASKTKNTAECRYSAVEQELLAVVWAVTKAFRHICEGRHVEVETDHKPLQGQLKIDELTGRLQRLAVKLIGLDLSIRYVKGGLNKIADALSRAAAPAQGDSVTDDPETWLRAAWCRSDKWIRERHEGQAQRARHVDTARLALRSLPEPKLWMRERAEDFVSSLPRPTMTSDGSNHLEFLELFSGTGGVSATARSMGFSTTTLDKEAQVVI